MGAITPIGNSVAEYWQALRAGKNGIGPITKVEIPELKIKVAAQVKNFNAEDWMSKKEVKRMDEFCRYAIAAAQQAVDMSGFSPEELKGAARIGVIVGSGIGGLSTMEESIIKMHEKGANRVNPLFIPMCIGNMPAGNIAIRFGVKGICSSVVTACATGNNCIGDAFRTIKHGYADAIIAGGAEASITRIGLAGFAALTALSESSDPDRASIPFDAGHDGFVFGEGAGVLIVEALEHAKKRGAEIYAEIVGYGSTGDAYHMTAPDTEGTGAAAAMRLAMEEAGVAPEQISYINAHGTSTPANDLPETKAIKLALGAAAYHTPVSSTKSMTGHLLGAAGAAEAIACIAALREGFIPPTIGFQSPAEGCDLNYVPNRAIEKDVQYTLSNSFGFGGHNAVLCFKKWED
jgi:3-oxoacyl-[acyl-carrier-protein] synthase II